MFSKQIIYFTMFHYNVILVFRSTLTWNALHDLFNKLFKGMKAFNDITKADRYNYLYKSTYAAIRHRTKHKLEWSNWCILSVSWILNNESYNIIIIIVYGQEFAKNAKNIFQNKNIWPIYILWNKNGLF